MDFNIIVKKKEIKERKNVNFITYSNNIYTGKNELIITESTEIKIHFSSAQTSLESFIDTNKDENAGNKKSIDLKNLDKTSITNMKNIFKGCNNLKSLDLSGFDMANIEGIGNMFADIPNLNYIDLTNFQHYESIFTEEIKKDLVKNKNFLIVCQNKNVLSGDKMKLTHFIDI